MSMMCAFFSWPVGGRRENALVKGSELLSLLVEDVGELNSVGIMLILLIEEVLGLL